MHVVTITHPTLKDINGNPAVDVETCSRIEDAAVIFTAALKEHGPAAATLTIDDQAFKDHQLEAYLKALNIEAHWHTANPQEGYWVPALAEDLEHWNRMGVFTPVDLAAYLDGCVAREMEKSRY